MLDKQKQHFSATQLVMAELCGERYRRRYIEGEVIPPNIAMVRGSGVHKARKVNLKQKVTTQKDEPLSVVTDAVRDTVNEAFHGDVVLDGEWEAMKPTDAKAKCIDSGVEIAKVDYSVFQVPVKPKIVEEKMEADLPGLERSLVGYMDLYDLEGIIHDLKTGSKSKSQKDADTSEQLTLYQIMAWASGLRVAGLQLESIAALKKGPKACAFRTTRDKDDMQAVLNRLAVVAKMIEAEVFVPAPADSWQCSERWCGYAPTCPYFIGRNRSR